MMTDSIDPNASITFNGDSFNIKITNKKDGYVTELYILEWEKSEKENSITIKIEARKK